MQSCLYRGCVRHRRREPVDHTFRYSLFWVYLDLAELPLLVDRRVLRSSRLAPASFRRDDHLGDGSTPLDQAVRRFVREETGMRLTGPVRLLTQLRYFGIYFSPINVFYCFDEQGDDVVAIVAEVSNTPWKETHYYVLWEGNRATSTDALKYRHPKSFHVSPFMPMSLDYLWRLSRPDNQLTLRVDTERDGRSVFHAELDLTRHELTRAKLAACLIRFPLASLQISFDIYFQALRLWLKKCPFYPHPKKSARTEALKR